MYYNCQTDRDHLSRLRLMQSRAPAPAYAEKYLLLMDQTLTEREKSCDKLATINPATKQASLPPSAAELFNEQKIGREDYENVGKRGEMK